MESPVLPYKATVDANSRYRAKTPIRYVGREEIVVGSRAKTLACLIPSWLNIVRTKPHGSCVTRNCSGEPTEEAEKRSESILTKLELS